MGFRTWDLESEYPWLTLSLNFSKSLFPCLSKCNHSIPAQSLILSQILVLRKLQNAL